MHVTCILPNAFSCSVGLMEVPKEQSRISGERLVLQRLNLWSRLCIASASNFSCWLMFRRTCSIIVHSSKFAFVDSLELVSSFSLQPPTDISGRVETEASGRAKIELVMTSSMRRLFQVRKLQYQVSFHIAHDQEPLSPKTLFRLAQGIVLISFVEA
jgi:hypothetical protein